MRGAFAAVCQPTFKFIHLCLSVHSHTCFLCLSQQAHYRHFQKVDSLPSNSPLRVLAGLSSIAALCSNDVHPAVNVPLSSSK